MDSPHVPTQMLKSRTFLVALGAALAVAATAVAATLFGATLLGLV